MKLKVKWKPETKKQKQFQVLETKKKYSALPKKISDL